MKKVKSIRVTGENRIMKEHDPTILHGIKGPLRSLAYLEKHASMPSKWITDRPAAVRKSICSSYPLDKDILMELWTEIYEDQLLSRRDEVIFVSTDLYTEELMERYIDKYRRSFKHKPLPIKWVDTHAKQLQLFDADASYFRETFQKRFNRWIAKLIRSNDEFIRKRNWQHERVSSYGTKLGLQQSGKHQYFYCFATNPIHTITEKQRNSDGTFISNKPKMVEIKTHYKGPGSRSTVTFMVSVFDIPISVAEKLVPRLGRGFSNKVALGKSIEKITPEQFMEIRTIINARCPQLLSKKKDWKDRHYIAMQTLELMLDGVTNPITDFPESKAAKAKTALTLGPDIPSVVMKKKMKKKYTEKPKKTTKPKSVTGRSTKHGHKETAEKELRVLIDTTARAESIAKWFSNNSRGISRDPKLYGFLFLHAVEDGVIKW